MLAKKERNANLIITEKPVGAAKIVTTLSGATDEKITTKDRVSYYDGVALGIG